MNMNMLNLSSPSVVPAPEIQPLKQGSPNSFITGLNQYGFLSVLLLPNSVYVKFLIPAETPMKTTADHELFSCTCSYSYIVCTVL
jgi:hypothetical protein